MRKGFPRIISVVLAAAMAFSLTACGGGQKAAETTAAQAAQTQVQEAAEKMEFLEAAQYRDEMFKLQELLKAKE